MCSSDLSDHFLTILIPAAATAVLIGIFALQRRGSGRVGMYFGPVTLAWFACIAATGIGSLIAHSAQASVILHAFNPLQSVSFFIDHPGLAMIVLSVPSLVIFLVSLWSEEGTLGTIFSNLSASLGLIFSVYYILTAVAAIVILRRVVLRRPGAFVAGLLLPGLAIVILVWAGYESFIGLSQSAVITVVGTLALAIVTVIASRFLIGSGFYKDTAGTETEYVDGAS